MTTPEVVSLVNFGVAERDVYKGGMIFEKHHDLQYSFFRVLDRYVSHGKVLGGDAYLVHDFNNYKHSKDSAHSDGDASDGRWRGLSLKDAVLLAMLYPFTGIFFYPHAVTPFFHTDQKTRNRPEGLQTIGFLNEAGDMITTNNSFDLVMETLWSLKI